MELTILPLIFLVVRTCFSEVPKAVTVWFKQTKNLTGLRLKYLDSHHPAAILGLFFLIMFLKGHLFIYIFTGSFLVSFNAFVQEWAIFTTVALVFGPGLMKLDAIMWIDGHYWRRALLNVMSYCHDFNLVRKILKTEDDHLRMCLLVFLSILFNPILGALYDIVYAALTYSDKPSQEELSTCGSNEDSTPQGVATPVKNQPRKTNKKKKKSKKGKTTSKVNKSEESPVVTKKTTKQPAKESLSQTMTLWAILSIPKKVKGGIMTAFVLCLIGLVTRELATKGLVKDVDYSIDRLVYVSAIHLGLRAACKVQPKVQDVQKIKQKTD